MENNHQDFLLSTEQELMTVVKGARDPEEAAMALQRFLDAMSKLAPSLPSRGQGFFNGYGRVYVDCGLHVELAVTECDSPYVVPLILERQQALARLACLRLRQEGLELLLANNNHSGLLTGSTSVWGAHENYLVERPPLEFSDAILPFLVTRVYGGAGGVEYPTGSFLAGVRPLFMTQAVQGGTTGSRAIHSTCREEHHMGPRPERFRYHLILGDGHRSAFNLALQLGATALVLKAILLDPGSRRYLDGASKLAVQGSWVEVLRKLNVLAECGQPLRAHPVVLEIQGAYLDAARHYADSLKDPPAWVPRLLQDWRAALDALEKDDRAWLAAHLDSVAKYELFSAVLREDGRTWEDLRRNGKLFYELSYLDQSYHELSSGESMFERLEGAGFLEHRVGPETPPGGESEPYVPETASRGRARARFIRENAHDAALFMDWSSVLNMKSGRMKFLCQPFAQDYGPWESFKPAG